MVKGIITPSITILNEEKHIDYKGNHEHIEYLIQSGVNGILFLGTIGEFFALEKEEKKEFISFVIDVVKGRVPIFIGTGGTVVNEVIELSKYAEKKGAEGVAVITPYFFQYNEDTLYNYYKLIAQNININLYIYNFPDRSGVNMSPQLVFKLARDFNNIKGIKDTMDSISHTRELISLAKEQLEDFFVYSGFDEYFLPNLLAGGDGLIGGLSNVAPDLFAKLYQSYQSNDFNAIIKAYNKICVLMEIYKVSETFFPAIKQAVAFMGRNIKPICKGPIKSLNSEQVNWIRDIIRRFNNI